MGKKVKGLSKHTHKFIDTDSSMVVTTWKGVWGKQKRVMSI